jgi:amino acid transporter
MRKKYLKDYGVQTVKTRKGTKEEAFYKGDYYSTDMPDEELKKYKTAFIMTSALNVVLFVVMGLLNNDASRQLYVALPYVALLLPAAFMLTGAVYFYRSGVRLTRYDYDKSFVRIKAHATASLYISAACVIGDIAAVLTGKTDTLDKELLFMAMGAAAAFFSFLTVQFHKKIRFVTVPNPGKQQ